MKTNRELPVGERRMDNHCEYILELRTEQGLSHLLVGCDGEANRRKVPGYRHVGHKGCCAVPDEAESVSFL